MRPLRALRDRRSAYVPTGPGKNPLSAPRGVFKRGGARGLPDGALFARAQAGDQRAYEIVYDRYAPDLFQICRLMLGDTTLAGAVLAETFETAFRQIAGAANLGDRLQTELARVAIDTCLLNINKASPEDAEGDEAMAEAQLLKEAERAVFALSEVGMSPDEIGEVLECGTVEACVRLATAHLELAA